MVNQKRKDYLKLKASLNKPKFSTIEKDFKRILESYYICRISNNCDECEFRKECLEDIYGEIEDIHESR